MITFLRMAGIGVAAIWLGGTALFVLLLHPLFGETDLIHLFGPLHTAELAYRASDRFHVFQMICASAGVALSLGDWLYSGKGLDKRILGLLLLLLAIASVGILGIVPKCRSYSVQAYLGPNRQVLRQANTPAQRLAERSLAVWEGLGLTANIVSFVGATLHFFSLVSTNGPGRPGSKPRLRG